jgi:chlorophyll synthase
MRLVNLDEDARHKRAAGDGRKLGAKGAARVACLLMVMSQLAVVLLLAFWQLPWHALAVLVLTLAQWPLMLKFLQQPVARALHVSAFGVPLFVTGMMVSAWGLRQLQPLQQLLEVT